MVEEEKLARFSSRRLRALLDLALVAIKIEGLSNVDVLWVILTLLSIILT